MARPPHIDGMCSVNGNGNIESEKHTNRHNERIQGKTNKQQQPERLKTPKIFNGVKVGQALLYILYMLIYALASVFRT